MNDDRDRELGSALRALPTPEHGPGFWEELERQLALEAPRAIRPDRRHRRRGHRPSSGPLFLAVAAAVALVVAAVAVLQPAERTRVVTEPPTTSTTVPPPSYRPGPEQDLGPGSVAGVSADGTAALLIAEDTASGAPGCEGTSATTLFATPLDGGARRRALAADEPVSEPLVRSTADPARVAVVSVCEEFLTSVLVAREEAGGVLADVTPIGGDAVDGLVGRFTWSRDGRSLFGIVSGVGDVVRIDVPAGTRETVLAGQGAFEVAELADGTLAVLRGDGSLRVGDEVHDISASGMAASPDGRELAAWGQGGLYLVAPGRSRPLVAGPVRAATWSPEGRALAYTGDGVSPDGGVLSVVTVEGAVSEIAATGAFGTARFTPDGRALVFTRVGPVEGEGETAVASERAVLVRFE